MDPETDRQPRGRPPADAYWRRRVFALVGLLAVVGGVAWVASGFGGGQQASSVGSRSTAAAVPAPTVTVTVTVTPTRPPQGFCADGDIEVKLLADRETYPAGRKPTFTIYVANTSDTACKRDVGPKALALRVLSDGQVVWDSDHCADSSQSDVRRLQPGEEYSTDLNWDRTRSRPGCAGERPAVDPGTYQLVGAAGGATSAELTFYLE